MTAKILLVDDNMVQRKLGRLLLEDAGFSVVTAEGADDALVAALADPPDLILSDVLMDGVDGFGLCRRLRQELSLSAVPIILCSAHYRSERDQALASRVGARELIVRSPYFDSELSAIRRCLAAEPTMSEPTPADTTLYEQHLRTHVDQINRLLGEAKQSETRYRLLLENAHDTVTVLTPDGVIMEANERWREVAGITPEEMIGRHIRDFSAPGHESENVAEYHEVVARGQGPIHAVPVRHADGRTIYMQFSMSTVLLDGKPLIFSIGRDVTHDVLAANALASAEEKYRSLLERIPDVIYTVTCEGKLTFITPNSQQLFGYTPEEMMAQVDEILESDLHPDDAKRLLAALATFGSDGKPFDTEYRRRRRDGRWIWIRNRAIASHYRNGVLLIDGMCSDITERRQLEDSVRQAQKMDAIGQLTGGIAHDFNNMLAAILANSHFLLEDLAEGDPRRGDAAEIRVAAERAAALTRQLLAFSRRQVLEPAAADLNATVDGLQHILRSMIGEDIELSAVAAPNLGTTLVDIGQIEQVIMNVVANARDAMPTGGRLCIETANVDVDVDADADAVSTTPLAPGRYVMLAVSDSGCGMDAETQRRMFEPFFTTKSTGEGSGLGLATTYGIVKQSGGYVVVYSEVGVGTTFKIYFPRTDGLAIETTRRPAVVALDGSETVLVVEDDEALRTAVERILVRRGYRVLIARDGQEARQLVTTAEHPIDLVLTDVIMPGFTGPEVSRLVQETFPSVRSLFMSGYTNHAVLRNGALAPGVNFIQKPFAPESLARKLREVLDA